MFEALQTQPPDELLHLIKQFADDPRDGKLDLGVGVYRDEDGVTPVMAAVKQAERILLAGQTSKSYLGSFGDLRFLDLLKPLVFGDVAVLDRVVGLQTPGGSGALRVAVEVIARARPGTRVWVGAPTWPNHAPLLSQAAVRLVEYPYFDIATQTLLFDRMMQALESAVPGDAVLLHGSCHNPTGADLDPEQWDAVIDLIGARGLLPVIDLAYQGLGSGLNEDAYGVRRAAARLEEALIAYSCDKNFAVYRERTGALFALGKSPAVLGAIASNMAAVARATWSMPPDHGAAAVRIVLDSSDLSAQWRSELAAMRARINAVRRAVAQGSNVLAPIGRQRGLFSSLSLSPEMATALRVEHGVYIVPSGRINLAGLQVADAPAFVRALQAVGYFS